MSESVIGRPAGLPVADRPDVLHRCGPLLKLGGDVVGERERDVAVPVHAGRIAVYMLPARGGHADHGLVQRCSTERMMDHFCERRDYPARRVKVLPVRQQQHH